jgi:hypothetical protein
MICSRCRAAVLGEAPYAIRNVLLYFFLLFVMRVTFRRGTLAGIAFTALMAAINSGNTPHAVNALIGVLYYGSAALVIVRWGLLPLAVGTFVSSLLFDIVITSDTSAWYLGNNFVTVMTVAGLALWGFWKAVPRALHAVST